MKHVSIIIPAYNEEKGIAAVLDDLRRLHTHAEIIVVDDGSTDRTGDIARELGATVIRHPINIGYGRSLKDGIAAATRDTIVITDADGSYPVEAIGDIVGTLGDGFDMVVGARSGKEYRGSILKMPARIVFKWLVEFATGRLIPDINSGLRAFSRQTVMRYFPDICDGFSFTTTVTLIYMLTGKTVTYMPIAYHRRIGRSKVRIIRDSLRTLQYITETMAAYNPLKLFLLLSMLSLGAAAACLLAFVFVPDIAFAILGSAFVLASVLVFGMGIQTYAYRSRDIRQ